MWAIAVSILFLIGITPLASAADFPVVDGERQATIVFSTDAKKITQSHWIVTASDPYTELAACIEKVTGRRLVTVREDDFQPAEGKFPIYVGNCRITQELLGGELGKLDRDGFMIVVEPERVFLAGPRVWSSYWAVCQFLEDYVGVRWLIPGPLGEDIPRQERIVVPVCRRVEEPVLLGRRWSGVDDRSGAEWSLRQRVTPTSRYNRYKFSHNLGKIFRPEEYFDEHPEYFPMRDGQRFRPATGSHSNWQPCMTEPGTVSRARFRWPRRRRARPLTRTPIWKRTPLASTIMLGSASAPRAALSGSRRGNFPGYLLLVIRAWRMKEESLPRC